MVEPTTAEGIGRLGTSDLPDERLLAAPAWTLNVVGEGAVALIPYELFRHFDRNRYPLVRQFVGEVMGRLVGPLPIRAGCPRASTWFCGGGRPDAGPSDQPLVGAAERAQQRRGR
jgi:hypothetical protein